jgi:hypothetical protein
MGRAASLLSNPPGMYSGLVISVGAFNRYRQRDRLLLKPRALSPGTAELAPSMTAPGSNIRSATHEIAKQLRREVWDLDGWPARGRRGRSAVVGTVQSSLVTSRAQ